MRVLVTGHRGFVGSATTAALRARGDTVTGYDVLDGQNLSDILLLVEAIERDKPDVILHEAAIAQFSVADANPILAHEVNVIGTQNVVRAANMLSVPIVFASTGSVYMPLSQEPPITEDFPAAGNSVYGVTKFIAEEYVKRATVPWIVLRYAHLYGANKIGHGLIGGFRAAIEAGRHPVVLGGEQTNDFTYIDDVVAANLAALDAPKAAWNEVYNVGTGTELSAIGAGRIICDVFDYWGEIDIAPPRSVDPPRFVYDTSKATERLGFTAKVDFRSGLLEMKARLEEAVA